jgi:hypothetical protein
LDYEDENETSLIEQTSTIWWSKLEPRWKRIQHAYPTCSNSTITNREILIIREQTNY